jgi:hypothetical protein
MGAAQRFFRSAQSMINAAPKQVTTDGHDSYPRAIRGKRTPNAVLTGSGDAEFGQAFVREAIADVAEEVTALGFGS